MIKIIFACLCIMVAGCNDPKTAFDKGDVVSARVAKIYGSDCNVVIVIRSYIDRVYFATIDDCKTIKDTR